MGQVCARSPASQDLFAIGVDPNAVHAPPPAPPCPPPPPPPPSSSSSSSSPTAGEASKAPQRASIEGEGTGADAGGGVLLPKKRRSAAEEEKRPSAGSPRGGGQSKFLDKTGRILNVLDWPKRVGTLAKKAENKKWMLQK